MELLNHTTYINGEKNPWVVFLHGAGGSIATWNKQLDAYKPHFNLLLIDLRDHGKSKNIYPPLDRYSFEMVSYDIKKVLDNVGVSYAHFVTLSFGSILMQDYAMRFAHTIDKIVVVGGVFSGSFWIRAFVFTARFFNIFLSYRQMYSIFSYVLMPYRRNQIARKVYQKNATQLTQKEYLKWVGLYYEFFNLLKTYHERTSDHNMLIIMGGDDYIFLEGAKRIAFQQPHTTLKVLPKVGHIANIESPTLFNDLSLDFLMPQSERQATIIPSDTN
ncbi:MAG: alpha/beta hydrolase [Bacteroidota bacterium]